MIKDKSDVSILKTAKKIGKPTIKNLGIYLESDSIALRNFITECSMSLAEVTNNAILILAPDKLVLFGDIFEHDTIVSLFTTQLLSINPTLPNHFCVKSTFREKKKYIGSTAIAVEKLLLI